MECPLATKREQKYSNEKTPTKNKSPQKEKTIFIFFTEASCFVFVLKPPAYYII